MAATGVLAALLSACGEVYQKAQLAPWKAAGSAVVPKSSEPESRRTSFKLQVQRQGQGLEVVGGSLVYARVGGTIAPSERLLPDSWLEVPDVWFWVGSGQLERPGSRPILRLGSPDLRAAFVGAHEGAVLTLRVDPELRGGELALPTKGFLLDYTSKYRFTEGSDSEHANFRHTAEYKFTIVRVCPATLLQRQGILKQWGYIPHLWKEAPNYPFARQGRIEFAALEADCGGENIRLEKGPAHRTTEGTLTMGWAESYERAVAKGRVSTLE